MITDDTELKARCRHRALNNQTLSLASSRLFVNLVDSLGGAAEAGAEHELGTEGEEKEHEVGAEWNTEREHEVGDRSRVTNRDTTTVDDPGASLDPDFEAAKAALANAVKREIFVRREIRSAQKTIKSGVSRGKRKKMTKKLKGLEEQLNQVVRSSDVIVSQERCDALLGRLDQVSPSTKVAPAIDGLTAHLRGNGGGGRGGGGGGGGGDSGVDGGGGGGGGGVGSSGGGGRQPRGLSIVEKEAVLDQLLSFGRGSFGGPEHTWERVVHAERFRQRLARHEGEPGPTELAPSSRSPTAPLTAYRAWIQSQGGGGKGGGGGGGGGRRRAARRRVARRRVARRRVARRPTARRRVARGPSARRPTALRPTARRPTARRPTARRPTARRRRPVRPFPPVTPHRRFK